MVVEVPKTKSLIAPLITTAAGLGIVQGFFWIILSLLSILLYEKAITPYLDGKATVGTIIYDYYLDKDVDSKALAKDLFNINLIIGAKEFNYFAYFYLLLSLSLLVISSVLLWASITGKSEKYYQLRLWIWTINMIILSLLDFIFLCLLSHDYSQINTLETADSLVLTSLGIVMTLAARGFVVWIINVVFIVILGKHLYNLKNKGRQPDPSVLDAYTTGSRPPWEMSNAVYEDSNNKPGYSNKGFRDDNDNPMLISSSQSFTHLAPNDRDNYANRDRGNQKSQNPYNNNGSPNNNNNMWNKRNQSENALYGMGGNNSPLRPMSYADRASDNQNQWAQPTPLRTAKIGRQNGQRSPPLNVNPPFIPDPDYSPPGSPRVRGVLRPKSNYAMY